MTTMFTDPDAMRIRADVVATLPVSFVQDGALPRLRAELTALWDRHAGASAQSPYLGDVHGLLLLAGGHDPRGGNLRRQVTLQLCPVIRNLAYGVQQTLEGVPA